MTILTKDLIISDYDDNYTVQRSMVIAAEFLELTDHNLCTIKFLDPFWENFDVYRTHTDIKIHYHCWGHVDPTSDDADEDGDEAFVSGDQITVIGYINGEYPNRTFTPVAVTGFVDDRQECYGEFVRCYQFLDTDSTTGELFWNYTPYLWPENTEIVEDGESSFPDCYNPIVDSVTGSGANDYFHLESVTCNNFTLFSQWYLIGSDYYQVFSATYNGRRITIDDQQLYGYWPAHQCMNPNTCESYCSAFHGFDVWQDDEDIEDGAEVNLVYRIGLLDALNRAHYYFRYNAGNDNAPLTQSLSSGSFDTGFMGSAQQDWVKCIGYIEGNAFWARSGEDNEGGYSWNTLTLGGMGLQQIYHDDFINIAGENIQYMTGYDTRGCYYSFFDRPNRKIYLVVGGGKNPVTTPNGDIIEGIARYHSFSLTYGCGHSTASYCIGGYYYTKSINSGCDTIEYPALSGDFYTLPCGGCINEDPDCLDPATHPSQYLQDMCRLDWVCTACALHFKTTDTITYYGIDYELLSFDKNGNGSNISSLDGGKRIDRSGAYMDTCGCESHDVRGSAFYVGLCCQEGALGKISKSLGGNWFRIGGITSYSGSTTGDDNRIFYDSFRIQSFKDCKDETNFEFGYRYADNELMDDAITVGPEDSNYHPAVYYDAYLGTEHPGPCSYDCGCGSLIGDRCYCGTAYGYGEEFNIFFQRTGKKRDE